MTEEQKKYASDSPMSFPPRKVLVGAVCSVCTSFAILWAVVPYGMFPHDEGVYAEMAVRILAGELPHRDFLEIYSGGLSYWHALLFWIFGEQLLVLRRALVLLAMPAVLAAYSIALRFTGSIALAAIVAVSGIIASVGTMHTVWAKLYLSLLSMIVAWVLIKHAEDDRPKWLLLAGMLCGIGLTIQITGLYTLAAAGLAVTYRGTDAASGPAAVSRTFHWTAWFEYSYRWTIAALAIGAGPLLVAAHPTVDTLLFFGMPTAAMGVALLAAGRRFNPVTILQRHSILLAGAVGVVALFLLPWIAAGAIPDLVDGVFIRPRSRLTGTYWPPPETTRCLFSIPLVLASLRFGSAAIGKAVQIAAAIAAAAGCFWAGVFAGDLSGMVAAMDAWRWFPAVGIPLSMAFVREEHPSGAPRGPSSAVYAIHSISVFSSLHQYPYSIPFYLLFVAPILMLSMVAGQGVVMAPSEAISHAGNRVRSAVLPVVVCVVSFTLLMGYRFGHMGIFDASWDGPVDDRLVAVSGVKVPASLAKPYSDLRALLDANLSPGQTILAEPECQEVYFFTKRRALISGIIVPERSYSSDLARIANMAEVGAVVINTNPAFESPWSAETVAPLVGRMRRRMRVGQFAVYYDPQPVADLHGGVGR